MDETRTRAVIREEIALALGALAASARYRDMPYETGEIEGTALRAIADSADGAVSEYAARCETADAQRAQDAENPFAEPEGEAVTVEMKALVRAEVLGILKDLRSTFYMSGLAEDYRIAERLDGFIEAREQATSE